MDIIQRFIERFKHLTKAAGRDGFVPYPWQVKLFERMVKGNLPAALDIPTGLGKTSVMLIWLLARIEKPDLPRRMVYVVDRRAVVDQATDEAERLAKRLAENSDLCAALGLEPSSALINMAGETLALPVSTLRGQFADNRKWSENPAHPAIVVGTVDMTGSRLLFNGYRLSKKQWPVHAGLLAYDSLIVLDEAHLNEPFKGLLEDVKRLVQEDLPGLPKPSCVMSLSATGASIPDEKPLTLEDDDIAHPHVQKLLTAPKPLTLKAPDGRKLPEQLAEEAWKLATDNETARRVLVFCHSRDEAGKTAELLRKKLAEHGKAEKKNYTETHLNLLVGERRVHERQDLRQSAIYKLFLGQDPNETPSESFDTNVPAFLVATSAGEVGIDLDAEAMICDLVPWERMVQRLGRVNRKGRIEAAPIVVIDTPDDKNPERQAACRSLLNQLPPNEDGGYDASIGAIRKLKETAGAAITCASTPPPLRPKLTLPILEGWALTSLQEEHNGSPDITPWLRGWIEEDEPQCEVFWRTYIPWRESEDVPSQKIINRYLTVAAPHMTEMLEAPVSRVVDMLTKRIGPAPIPQLGRRLRCALLFDHRGNLLNQWTHDALHQALTQNKDRFRRALNGKRLLLQADIGGLSEAGLLDKDAEAVATLDNSEAWANDIGLSFVMDGAPNPDQTKAVFDFSFAAKDDEHAARLVVGKRFNLDDANENTAISCRAQSLADHHACAGRAADWLSAQLGFAQDDVFARMLRRGLEIHDAGKARKIWQNAMGVGKDRQPLAKTEGIGHNSRALNGYRHEFGTLLDSEAMAYLEDLEGQRDLGVHLIATHHGRGRPYINAYMPYDRQVSQLTPPSKTAEAALDVALRFARLQKEWGPWGLAWWEAVFRASDALASMWNDRPELMPGVVKAQLEAAE